MYKHYIYALLPIWFATFVICLFFAFSDGSITLIKTILNISIYTVLPLIAGYQIVKINNSLLIACAAAMSVSLIEMVTSSVAYLIQAAPWLAYLGLFFSILFFQLIPQVIFGSLGGLLSRRLNLVHHSSGTVDLP
jgi:hypothetical protein